MLMMKAIIIDDEPPAVTMLEKMLDDLELPIEIVGRSHELADGVNCIKEYKPDLVFLDIEMPGFSGLQLFDFLEDHEIKFGIIFITAYNQYAINAFEMNAVDYLLKPLQADKLEKAINKFLNNRNNAINNYLSLKRFMKSETQLNRIVIPIGNALEVIKVDDIIFLQAEGSYTKIFLSNNKNLLVSKKLKYFEQLLNNSPSLFRIHRSYIVNLNAVNKLIKSNGGTVVMKDETELPISNHKFEEFLKLLAS